MREVAGGIPDEIRQKQLDHVLKIHLEEFDLTYNMAMVHKKQYEGRRIVFLGSISQILRDQYYWAVMDVSRQTGKPDSGLLRAIKELEGLYPPHPTTKHLIDMHEKAAKRCAESELI